MPDPLSPGSKAVSTHALPWFPCSICLSQATFHTVPKSASLEQKFLWDFTNARNDDYQRLHNLLNMKNVQEKARGQFGMLCSTKPPGTILYRRLKKPYGLFRQ